MPTDNPLDFELHQAHLEMCDEIDELRAQRDYEGLERVRRELFWLLEELRLVYHRAHTAIAMVMPAEGFWVDGTYTYQVRIGDRIYVEHDRSGTTVESFDAVDKEAS